MEEREEREEREVRHGGREGREGSEGSDGRERASEEGRVGAREGSERARREEWERGKGEGERGDEAEGKGGEGEGRGEGWKWRERESVVHRLRTRKTSKRPNLFSRNPNNQSAALRKPRQYASGSETGSDGDNVVATSVAIRSTPAPGKEHRGREPRATSKAGKHRPNSAGRAGIAYKGVGEG